MPLENSGNMLFMLLALVQRLGVESAKGWLPPYMPMLRAWTDELVRTTLFPANQICTDDFTGPLANNTNLGQKGIVAIRAYAELCMLMGLDGAPDGAHHDARVDCASYAKTASKYAHVWEKYAYSATGPHYKMSYNDLPGISESWSFKYNLLWQRILNLDGPFDYDSIAKVETAWYASKVNAYGTPMDPRHQCAPCRRCGATQAAPLDPAVPSIRSP